MDSALLVAITLAGAIFLVILSYYIIKRVLESRFSKWLEAERQALEQEREKIRKMAITQSRAVLGGKFVEQLAPYLPQFKYDPTEARFIGSPIDLIVFPGLATGDPKEIVIMEIKTGKNCQLTPQQRKISQLVEEGMVRWELIQKPYQE
ncbi:MAG: Holliday junction resolvase-like protein [Dehalococcoidales bacterium]